MNSKAVRRRLLSIGLLLLTFGVLGLAQEPAQNAPSPDNTKLNQRDRDANQPTADQQQNNRSDRDITQQIRKSITEDKTLSTEAHNVKVITQNGQVTLEGNVQSDEEKQALETKAAAIAGEGKVTSELTVKSKS